MRRISADDPPTSSRTGSVSTTHAWRAAFQYASELAGSCIAGKTTAEWLALLREREIPAARVASLDEVLADPQLAATGFFRHATHPTEGEILYTDLPVRFGGASVTSERLQPRLGEHSVEVLRDAGLAQCEIEALVACGATLDGGAIAAAAE